MPQIQCEYCGKWVRSKRGLEAHLRQSELCLNVKAEIESSATIKDEFVKRQQDPVEMKKRTYHVEEYTEEFFCEEDAVDVKIGRAFGMDSVHTMKGAAGVHSERSMTKADIFPAKYIQNSQYRMPWLPYKSSIGDYKPALQADYSSDSFDEVYGQLGAEASSQEEESGSSEDESSSSGNDGEAKEENDLSGLGGNRLKKAGKAAKAFKKYVRYAHEHVSALEESEATAVKIMQKLIKKRAPLDTYEAVMRWHLIESGCLAEHELLGDSPRFITRKKLMQLLRIRYHMVHQYAKPQTITLPFCRSKIQVWKKLAQDNVLSLLTDPRWNDQDWLYFEDDPFAPPPENHPYIEDINTGEAYIETYKQLITDPKRQILVPIPLYIDGAVTGQFDKLQVTALKMTIGILNRKARDKEYAWRNLGFVTNYAKEDHRGQKIFVESGHIAAVEMYLSSTSDEDEVEVDEEDDKLADYHAILSTLLESLKELIAQGMVVDIQYKGTLHKDCELVFFVPFIKCDGDEADKLCASFRSRSKNVKQLCRYCKCPNGETDNPKANYPFKTEPMMRKLFEKNNVEKLRNMSQSCIPNAFHGLRFGLHNERGVHGACPFELLHAVLLGIFKYARDCFFEQLGESSFSAKEINALAQQIGSLLQKQSDRNKPRTKFAKGILKGKLMAKEYTGVMLVMAALLQTVEGRAMLKSGRKKEYRQEGHISDWVLLIETLLQWEAYLNLPQMDKTHLQRLKKKHQFLLFLLKKVGAREKGMGFKVMKFHAVLHLAQDIEMFGVPMVVDTGSNESHHKTTKIAAKLTQKDVKTFEKQTSDRLDDFQVLDLALAELDGRPLWDYFDGYLEKIPAKAPKKQSTIGGMVFKVYEEPDTKELTFKVLTRMKGRDDVKQDSSLLHFVDNLQWKLSKWLDFVPVHAEHNRSGQIFRSHPNFRGKGAWRDWVMVKWNTGDFPSKIWGFVDLSYLPDRAMVRLDDDTVVRRGVWAIIESCNYKKDPPAGSERGSELFKPVILDAASFDKEGAVETRKFYLVDVESFKSPLVVIPNVGTACEYLVMTPRDQWSEDFKRWIQAVHKDDEDEMGGA